MKKIIHTFKTYMLLVVLFATTISYSQTPIVLDTSPNISTCDLSGENVIVSAPTEVLTGDNIKLEITLPGDYAATCVKTVSITNSSNLVFQGSAGIPLTNMGGGTYQNDPTPTTNGDPGPLIGNQGYNFNVYYQFPNHTTCDGTVGTFDVTVTLDCAGVITTCTTSVSVIARAANYWTVTKQFVIGDLVCGTSKWRIKVINNNPNPSGYGNYKIQGTLTENTSLPVVSNAVINISGNDWIQYNYITLQNCQNTGTIITNNIDYNFSLGDGCETMIGTDSADSDPLQSPNESLAFTKSFYSTSALYSTVNGYQISAGCSGYYSILIHNNGNVPWQINSITDVIPTDITVTGISDTNYAAGYTGIDPSMWVNPPTISGQTYTFTPASAPYLLNPGDSKNIYFYFDVNSSVPTGSIITNTAHINYNAGSVTNNNNSGSGTQCSGVNCPQIDQSIKNDTAICTFKVIAPFPKEIFKKCVTNQAPGNIYTIGDLVHFKYVIGNAGSGNLGTTITDFIGLPNQNLLIQPLSITQTYYENNSYSTNNWLCNTNFSNPQPIAFTVNYIPNNQNPSFVISGLPGNCDYSKANYLVIEFDAEVLPQIYGNKTNTAYTDTKQSSASYTVDQIGILEVHKYADQEIVENGGNFNYIIEVTNNGSVPLNNIVITDMLPDCISLNGQISIEDDLATPIPFTTNGSLTININPTTEIFPGNDFTITIPATKSGGGNCCNESVSATAEMITSSVELSANYGSSEAPAACVTGTECCDIEDFEASIIQDDNGSFDVTINGGSVPIQEVEISMVDYHIEYSEEACKPDDLGIFGTLTTSTTNLNNLILNTGDSGTSSLAWLLGNPSIINTSVNFDILYPDVLNLECCDVEFYFCLKVKVKDVNCNVCEKIICFTNEREPCEIGIKPFGQSQGFCVGDTVNLNWTGTTPTGAVNISLFDNTNNSIYSVIASGIPNIGSFTYIIPSGFPCDPPRNWSFIVEDSERLCFDKSDPFIIKCCDDDCDCGEWLTNSIFVKGDLKKIPKDPKQKINFHSYFEKNIECGSDIEMNPSLYYTFTAPNYVCNPEDCEVEYKWEVEDPDGVIISGNGKVFNYSFNIYGNYKITFTPICGGNQCEPCIIYPTIEKQGPVVIDGQNYKPTKY